MRLINCPQPTIDAIREILKTRWSRGIDVGEHYLNSFTSTAAK